MRFGSGSGLKAVVSVSRGRGRESVESELPVRSLEELYATCRDAPASSVVQVSLNGPDGEVRLNFASLIRKTRQP